MKTAMQELIEWVILELRLDGYEHEVIRTKATELLGKEKEQIMEAYVDAQAHENRGLDSLAYYNKNYSQ